VSDTSDELQQNAISVSSQLEAFLHRALRERRNILIIKGTGKGKTPLSNALLREMSLT
jgi:Flp pilus assembly CpaF family ATPase